MVCSCAQVRRAWLADHRCTLCCTQLHALDIHNATQVTAGSFPTISAPAAPGSKLRTFNSVCSAMALRCPLACPDRPCWGQACYTAA